MNVILAALILISLSISTEAEGKQLFGAGASASCGSWLHDRESGDYYSMGNWALGYLSGIGIYTTLDPLNDVDANGVSYWLDNYCRNNPTVHFSEALDAFVRAHPR
jgi:hypothetical protein